MYVRSIQLTVLIACLIGGISFAHGQQVPPKNNPYAPNKFQYEFVATGANHSVALRCDGTIRTWGANGSGQLGNNNMGTDEPTPIDPGESNVVSVAAGSKHTVILKQDSTVWAAGANGSGRLGDGTTTDRDQFVQVIDSAGNPLDSIVSISAGNKHTVALQSDNTLWSWGGDGFEQLANGGAGAPNQAEVVDMDFVDTTIAQVECGMLNTYILQVDGTVKASGANQFGQVGGNIGGAQIAVFRYTEKLDPTSGNFATGIAGGGAHALAVLDDGSVLAWGKNDDQQLSNACGGNSCDPPVEVTGVSDAVAVAAGSAHSLALTSDSTVMAWGLNDVGQCGQGNFTSPLGTPQAVSGYSGDPYAISAPVTTTGMGQAPNTDNGNHSMALIDLSNMDSLETMGSDDRGQIGDDAGTGDDENAPVRVIDYTLGLLDADAGNDTIACAGDSVEIGPSTSDTSKFDYSWTPTIGMSDSTVPNPKVALSPNSSVTVSYILTKTYDGAVALSTCIKRDTVQVTFNAGAEASFAHNGPKCEGESVDFDNTGSSGASYDHEWDFGSGSTPSTSTSEDPPLVTYSSFGVKTVTHTVFDSVCNDTVTEKKGITIHEEPTAGFNSSAPACEEEDVDFTNTGSSGSKWNYSWDFGSGSSPNTSNAENPSGIQYSSSGTKLVTQTITDDNGHCSATDTNSITIGARPDAAIASNAPACTGEEVDFDNSGSSGGVYDYSWTFGGGSSPSSASVEDPPLVTYSSSGVKKVRLIITNTSSGCKDTAEISITIHETPSVGFNSNAPVCEGSEVNFTNSGSSGSKWNYDWSFGKDASPQTSTAENPSGIVYSSGGTKTVTQTISSNYCQAGTTQTIDIGATPEADLTHDGPGCTEDTVQFSYVGVNKASYSYQWDFGAGANPSTATGPSSEAVYSSTGNKQVRLVVENTNSGCSDTAYASLSVFETPDPGFSSTAPVCEGLPVDFSNTGSSGSKWSYSWDFGSGASPSSSSAEDPSGISYSSSGTKTVTQTIIGDNGHCSAGTTQTIGVLARPSASFSTTAPECTGDSLDFSNTGSSGAKYSYQWDFGAGASPATSTLENPSGISYSSAGLKQAMLVIENTNTGCTDTSTKEFTIHQSPTVSFTSTAPVCAGEAVDFTNTGSSGGQWSYNWDFGSGADPNGSSAENPSGISYRSGGSRAVTLTVSSAYCQRTDSMMISIDSLPEADAGPDTTICANDPVTIGTPAQSGNSYAWSPIGTLDDPFVAQPTAEPVAEFTTYHLLVEDTATGCKARDSVQVTMLTSGLVKAGPDATICNGDSVQLGKGLIEGQTYDWDPDSSLNDGSSPHPVAGPDTTTLYTLKVSKQGCDTLSDQVEVTVRPLPDAEAGPDVEIVRGERTRLNASGGVAYKWTPDLALTDDQLSSPYASPDSTTLYKVWVTDIHGCRAKDSLTVRVITPERFVPNAFTPDGDGKNDVFRVRGPELEDFRMEIFDRSGERIFMTDRYEDGWDGRKYPSDQKAPQGAYPYLITGTDENGKEVRIKGMVNLLR